MINCVIAAELTEPTEGHLNSGLLARLDMSDEQKAKLGTQLDDILGYFDKLNAVDVEGVEPMAHAHRVSNVWREGDEPRPNVRPSSLSYLKSAIFLTSDQS